MFESAPAEAAPMDTRQTGLTAKSGNDGARALYFFHIPKTGGRTVIRHVERRYGKSVIVNPSKNKVLICDIFLKKKFLTLQSLGDRHIVGHFASFSLLRGRENRYYKACFWRNPATWCLSLYNYRHHRNSKKIKTKIDFADFCRSFLRNPMTGYLLLRCADVRGWTYFFMSDKRKFDLACATIERFDRFDDIAKVDEFLEFIGHENGQKPKCYNRLSPSEKALQYIDEPTIAEIERQYAVDFFLHKIALGADIHHVRDQAARALNRSFDPRDVVRLLLLPYYRYKIWVTRFGRRSLFGGTRVCSISASSEPEKSNSIRLAIS